MGFGQSGADMGFSQSEQIWVLVNLKQMGFINIKYNGSCVDKCGQQSDGCWCDPIVKARVIVVVIMKKNVHSHYHHNKKIYLNIIS